MNARPAPVRRALRVALWLVLPLVLLGGAGWLLGSEAGLRFALARADGALTGGLEVARARGTLAGPLELEGVELDLGRTRIAVARLAVDLRITPLLLGRVQATTLEADGVRVQVTPDPAAPPFALPERIDLPVHVALERFAVRDLEVQVGAAPPIALARLSGSASADARGLRFDDLEAEHARGVLHGRAALGLARPFPAEATLALELARPGAAPLATTVEASGPLEALRLRISADAPLSLDADLTVHGMFDAPKVAGTLACQGSRPAELDAAVAALGPTAFDCRLEFEAAADRTVVRGSVRAVHPEWRPAVLELALAATPELITLERGALRFEGAPLSARMKGRFALDDAAHRFQLEVDARELGLPTRVPGPTLAANARLAFEGDLDAARATLSLHDHGAGTIEAEATLALRARRYAIDATAADLELVRRTVAGARLARATLHAAGDSEGADLVADATIERGKQQAVLHAEGRLTPAALTFDALHADLLGGSVAGKARLDLGPGGATRWRATLAARELDPQSLDARFRGRLAAELSLDGGPAATVLELSGLRGTLRERAVSGHAKLRHSAPDPGAKRARAAPIGPAFAPTLALESLELRSGTARIEAAFDARRLRVAFEAPDLADLVPTGRGRLTLHAALVDGHATLDADGAGVQFGPLRLASITADAKAPADGAVAAKLALLGLDVGDLRADEITLGAEGPRDAVLLSLDARLDQGRLRAAARGTAQGRGFLGTLEKLELDPEQGETWSLAAPSTLRIGSDGLQLAEACLGDGKARGCLGGGWHPVDPWRVNATVHGLAIGAFGGLLARGLDYQGTLELELEATGRGPLLGESRALLTLSAGSIKQPARRIAKRKAKEAPPLPTTLLDFGGGRIELSRRGERTAMEARFALAGGGKLEATLAATGTGPFAARALEGRITADHSQFALLPALLPELKSLTGRVTADVALSGTVGDPRYRGNVAFAQGTAAMPQFGLELSEIEATLEGSGEALRFAGQARSGGLLHWRADLDRSAGRWRANGRLWGEQVRILDTPEARVVATPALLLDLDGDALKLSGEIAVPSARLAPRSLATAVQATGDEVIVDTSGEGSKEDALRIDARVRLKLGDDVRFDGFGLTAKVRGEITVTERPGALAIASGELALADGKYEAYGQDLTIERGRLLFSGGPVTNPGVDVRAKRTVERPTEDEDVVVGIDVRGTLRSPETTIFATPSMSSSDALAYLVIGRPLADSTDAEQTKLTDAASSMKLSGGEFLAQQIGRRIGLDEVRVSDADDPAEAQLWLGTYLSPRLFVSYGMGLFEQFHTARVRYSLSSKWSVEAESGRESSADVKYTIER